MRSLKLEKHYTEDSRGTVYAFLLDCDRCGVKSGKERIFGVQYADGSDSNLCINCLHKRHPEMVKVVE